jgi:predicted RNase H-related nuclease YkuK (DUF458 family)
MKRVFKKLVDGQNVDLIPYIKDYVSQNENVEILIGCDSQNRKKETIYAVVIGLYKPGKGAHVLYTRFTTPRERDNISRLLNEVWFSTEVAEEIRNDSGVKASWIDIDLNPDPRYRSNQALSSAVGIVTGMGYRVRHKGLSPMMCYCADSLVKKQKPASGRSRKKRDEKSL